MTESNILSSLREIGIKLTETGKAEKMDQPYSVVAMRYIASRVGVTASNTTEFLHKLGAKLIANKKLKVHQSRPQDVINWLFASFGIEAQKPLVPTNKRNLH